MSLKEKPDVGTGGMSRIRFIEGCSCKLVKGQEHPIFHPFHSDILRENRLTSCQVHPGPQNLCVHLFLAVSPSNKQYNASMSESHANTHGGWWDIYGTGPGDVTFSLLFIPMGSVCSQQRECE